MSDVVIVLAKAPQEGKVKTRLAESVGPEKALMVYEELLNRTFKTLESGGFTIHLHLDGPEQGAFDFPAAPIFSQSGSNIGERMHQAFLRSADAGARKMLLVGTDIPELSPEILNRAFEFLDHSDAVFGPSEDGGYYLIGLKEPKPELFAGVQWSTAEVLSQSLEICQRHKWAYSLVDTLNDIDTFEDLRKSSLNNWFTLNFGT